MVVFIVYFSPVGLKRMVIQGNTLVIEQFFKREIIPIADIKRIQMIYTTDQENIERTAVGVDITTDKHVYQLSSQSGFWNKIMRQDFDYNIIPQILVRNPRIQTAHDMHSYVINQKISQVYLYHHQALYGLGVIILLVGLVMLLNTLALQGYFYY